ncbi:hypothetical protein V1477_017875 [Vespula maculifrons]|uniref:Uncharacterized protein n=1 Tax=Vespula maculifrons TaxID=7453 RepID=A0ABD2AZM6_VESMC
MSSGCAVKLLNSVGNPVTGLYYLVKPNEFDSSEHLREKPVKALIPISCLRGRAPTVLVTVKDPTSLTFTELKRAEEILAVLVADLDRLSQSVYSECLSKVQNKICKYSNGFLCSIDIITGGQLGKP